MSNYALLGRKLSHSISPQIHRLLGGYDYDLIELEPHEVENFVGHGDYAGLNVTIPYKIDVMPLCTRISELAQRIGSVNTIRREADATLSGHNTDYFGFAYMLRRSGVRVRGKKVLVLGDGGSARTVRCVLSDEGAGEVVTISRRGDDNYDNIARHADAAVIINTTPVGMYPNVEDSPVCLTAFPACKGVLDLIYNPAKTRLLQQGEQLGIPTANGLPMLVAQGAEAVEIFTGAKISAERVEEVIAELAKGF